MRALPYRLLPLLLTLFVLAPFLGAQSVHWELPSGQLAVGKLEGLELVFEGCSPESDPEVPKVPNLTLVFRGQSQNVSIVNGRMSRTVTYTFAARLEKKEQVQIPSFAVETNKGKLKVPALSIKPGEATIGSESVSIEDVAQSRFQLANNTVWAGEVFSVAYRFDILQRYYHQLASNPEWDPTPLVVEDWAKPTSAETRRGNDPQLSIQYRTRAYAKVPGSITLNPINQTVNIQTGVIGGFLMSQPRLEQIVVNSDQPTLLVKPLPSPAPNAFSGAVGQFKFVSKVVPENAKVGEPITWTLELTGTGNWPDIPGMPSRSVSKSFEVIQPQAKRSLVDNKLFEGSLSEDVVLMPTRPGNFDIGPVSFTYFDPKSGSYKTISSEKVTVTVQANAAVPALGAGAAPGLPQASAASPALKSESPEPKPQLPPAPAKPVPSLPLDGSDRATVPLKESSLLTLVALPLLLLLGFWASLAWTSASAADPAKLRRLALRRLRLQLKEAGEARPKHAFLLTWQRDLAQVLGLGTAAPTYESIRALTTEPGREKSRPVLEAIAQLWLEADKALYAPQGSLPEDWITRARKTVSRLRAPSFPVYHIFFPRHCMPWWFATLGLVLFLQTTELKALEARAAYEETAFDRAAAQWKKDLNAAPLDWRTRHNLGLALLQQGKHSEAVGQLATAFAQHPSDETLRRNFLIAMEHAGYAPQTLGTLAQDHPLSELARRNSPFGWQLTLCAALFLFVIGLGLLLLTAYGLRRRGARPLALVLVLLGLLSGAAALASLHAFGLAANRRAALIWQPSMLRSVPTEADSTQKTSALPAGTLAVVEKEFLGWRQVRFQDGDTGWIRSEDLVQLWH